MAHLSKITVGISLFLHAIAFYFLLEKKLPLSEEKMAEIPKLYFVEEKDAKGASKKSRKNIRKKALLAPNKAANKNLPKKWEANEAFKKFQSFSPKVYDDHYYGESGGSESSPFRGEWSDKPVMATLQSMDLPEISENIYFFELLRERINRAVLYPKDLAEHKITGKIWVKILVDPKGQLLQVLSKSNKQPVLEAYVIVNIFEALKEVFPQKYWYSKNKDLAFLLNFDFSVSSVPNQKPLHFAQSEKNRMDFIRRAKIPNLLEELATDYARYFPPIVPTPAGPIINFVQVYRMIEAWSDLNPIERKKQRLRLTKQKINLMLKRQKNREPSGSL